MASGGTPPRTKWCAMIEDSKRMNPAPRGATRQRPICHRGVQMRHATRLIRNAWMEGKGVDCCRHSFAQKSMMGRLCWFAGATTHGFTFGIKRRWRIHRPRTQCKDCTSCRIACAMCWRRARTAKENHHRTMPRLRLGTWETAGSTWSLGAHDETGACGEANVSTSVGSSKIALTFPEF